MPEACVCFVSASARLSGRVVNPSATRRSPSSAQVGGRVANVQHAGGRGGRAAPAADDRGGRGHLLPGPVAVRDHGGCGAQQRGGSGVQAAEGEPARLVLSDAG